MLTHYADKVDWQSISSNNKVVWTKSLIHKFTDKLNWEGISLVLNSVNLDGTDFPNSKSMLMNIG